MSARWTCEVMGSARAYRIIRRDGKIVAMDVEPRAADFLVAAANLVDEKSQGPCLTLATIDNRPNCGCVRCVCRRIKALDAPEYPEGREA